MNKIIIETTLKELEKHGLVVCKCGHPPNNHFLQFEDNDKSCAHCDCKNYSPKILLGKKAGQVEPEVKVQIAEEEYNKIFDELNKNFTAYNWFLTTKVNDEEAKKRWDRIREIISNLSA